MPESQRQLYNAALQERSDAWRPAGVSLTWQDQFRSLTVCRREIPEMAAVPVAIQRGTLKRLEETFRGFFRRARAGQKPGSPRFRGRHRFDSIATVSGVKPEAGRIRLAGFGRLTIRRRGGTPVSAVLKREAGRWSAVVCHPLAVSQPEDDGTVIGVDMNAGQGRVDGSLAASRPPQTRACASNALGSSHDRFAQVFVAARRMRAGGSGKRRRMSCIRVHATRPWRWRRESHWRQMWVTK